MEAESKSRKVLVVVVSVLLLLLSAASVWAVVSDYLTRDIVTKGVTLVGHDLTGMNGAQVKTTIEDAVSTPMMRPVTVTGDNKTWVLDPKQVVSVDVGSMFKQAYAPRRSATLVTRLASRIAGRPLAADVKPAFSVDTSVATAWIKHTAAAINRKPVDATRSAAPHYAIRITPAVYGASLDQTKALDELSQALTADAAIATTSRVVSLPVNSIRPKVLQSSFKMAIVVSLSQCRLRLYNGTKLIKTYAIAPGQPAWPTPKGDFKIVTKQANAPWYNPHSTWSASMPDVIPGGPGNPMGDRKIGINYPGVFMHGVPPGEYGSIGSHASHGCMRMLPSQVHDLYARVSIGDPVFIRE